MLGHDTPTVKNNEPLYEQLDYGVKYYATRKLQPYTLMRSGGIEEYFATREALVEGIKHRVGPKLWRLRLHNSDIDVLIEKLGGAISSLDFAEIGCNTGYFLHSLALKGAKHCIGYDFTNNENVIVFG